MQLIFLLLVAGVIELSVLILVGNALGVLPTVGLLIAAAVIGAWLLRREGRRTLAEMSEAVRLRRPPTREFADGVLVAVGGVLIVLPGFVSDIAGLACLFPPTRALLRRRFERAAEERARAMQEQMRTHAQQGGRRTSRSGSDDVIEGEVVSVSEDEDPSEPTVLPPRDQPSGREES